MSNEGTTIFRAWLNNVVQLARFLSFRWALFLGRIWRRLCQASLCGQREASNFLVNYFCKKYIFLKCKPTSEVLTNAIFIKKIGCNICVYSQPSLTQKYQLITPVWINLCIKENLIWWLIQARFGDRSTSFKAHLVIIKAS